MLTVEEILKHKPPPSPTIDRRRLIWLGKHTVQRIEAYDVVTWTLNGTAVEEPKTIDDLSKLLSGDTSYTRRK